MEVRALAVGAARNPPAHSVSYRLALDWARTHSARRPRSASGSQAAVPTGLSAPPPERSARLSTSGERGQRGDPGQTQFVEFTNSALQPAACGHLTLVSKAQPFLASPGLSVPSAVWVSKGQDVGPCRDNPKSVLDGKKRRTGERD